MDFKTNATLLFPHFYFYKLVSTKTGDSSAEKMDILRQCRSLILSHRNKNTKLYLPGLVYHAYYKESGGGNQLTVELSDYSLFNELVFGNNCFTDHLPTRYDSMISKL